MVSIELILTETFILKSITKSFIIFFFHTEDVSTFIRKQQKNYAGHVVRMPVDRGIKQLMFNSDKYHRFGRTTPSLLEQVLSDNNLTVQRFINLSSK